MNAVREMLAATKGLVQTLHASLTRTQADVSVLQDHVLELMETRAEVERLRAQASAAVSRSEELSEQVTATWELIKQLKADSLSQDVRIADLEALEGYGWRAPPVYEPTLSMPETKTP